MIVEKAFEHAEIYVFQQPKKGKSCCGDSYFIHETKDYLICAVADGLGSGNEARISSSKAISIVESFHEEDVKSIMDRCNESLRHHRGVVMTIFKIHYHEKELEYCSVGNISFFLYSPTYKVTHPLPTSGFLSGRPQLMKVKQIPFHLGSSFVIFSDGLKARSIKQLNWSYVESPRRALNEIEQSIHDPSDDITFLVGKISE